MKNFHKDDLQTGMILVRRNGDKRMVIKDGVIKDICGGIYADGIMVGEGTKWDNLNTLTDNLFCRDLDNSDFDIVRVEKPCLPCVFAGNNYTKVDCDLKVIWER